MDAYLCIAVQGEPRKRNLKRLKGSKKKPTKVLKT